MKKGVTLVVCGLLCLACTSEPKPKRMGVQCYDDFPAYLRDTIRSALEEYYGVKTVVLPAIELPSSALSLKKSPRYKAQDVIKFQLTHRPDTLDYILGLTTKDICITKRDEKGRVLKPEWKYTDFGIMGLAYRPGKSAIVSTFRLHHSSLNVVNERAKKVAIHEFGHNLGIPHCQNSHCVMTVANEKISTIDHESLFLCERCKKRIMDENHRLH